MEIFEAANTKLLNEKALVIIKKFKLTHRDPHL